MLRIVLFAIGLLPVFPCFSQANHSDKNRIAGFYSGVTVGYNFDRALVGADIQCVFTNSWGVQTSVSIFSEKSRNTPSDYYSGAYDILPPLPPNDQISLFTLMATKRIELRKNFGLVFMLGPNLMYEKVSEFEYKVSRSKGESNYEIQNIGYYGYGLTGRVGIYSVVSSWCGFQLDLVGNINERRNYTAVCLTWNLGWMGKEK